MPVGREIPEEPAYAGLAAKRSDRDMGSIIAVVATDAPLLPHQLKRIARRVSMGIARTGSVASNSSGDIFIAFSTANEGAALASGLPALKMLPNERIRLNEFDDEWGADYPTIVKSWRSNWARITPFFEATVYAVEEAIINALVAAETMDGYAGHRAIELPEERLRAVLRTYNRLDE